MDPKSGAEEASPEGQPLLLGSMPGLVQSRQSRFLLAGLLGIAVLSWFYMHREAREMDLRGVCRCMGMAMSGPDVSKWSPAALLPLFLMWAEMMVAMMLPSAAPTILMYSRLMENRRAADRTWTHPWFFLTGYLLVWTLFSAAAAAVQWALHGLAWLSADMAFARPVAASGTLVFAGLFQFTRFKSNCLRHCQNPWSFFSTKWREGKTGALHMGFRHGIYCTGCCWLLMVLLFVAGVMNLYWIAVLTALVLIEKSAARSTWPAKLAGFSLITWGIALLLAP